MQFFSTFIRLVSMKALIQLSVLIILISQFSCRKEVAEKNHYEMINQKILDFDNNALIGKWERVEMTTWDYQDNFIVNNAPEALKITRNYWITEGQKRAFTLTVFTNDCGIYGTELRLETNGALITVPFGTYGWKEQFRFWVFEYPDDPAIFRIDKRYKPVGYPD